MTVYRYFDHKEDVFLVRTGCELRRHQTRLDTFGRNWDGKQLDEVFPQIMTLLVDIVAYSPQTVRLVAVALLELGVRAREECKKQLEPLFRAICRYLTMTMDSHQLENIDPAIVATTIILTVLIGPEVARLINGSCPPCANSRRMVESYTDFWHRVLEPLSAT